MVTLSRNFQLGLIILVAFNLLPHLDLHFLPVVMIGGTCLIWRLLIEYQIVRLPHIIIKTLLVSGCTYWVFSMHGRLLGLEPGSALLIMAISLKLVDRADYHDAMMLLLLVFMLLLVKVLESQTLWMTLFGALDLVVVTTLLVQLHSHQEMRFNLAGLLKTGSKLVLQISPFMFVLFFVFPRLSGHFGLLSTGEVVSSGFSSTLKPGAIGKLARSNAVAFRMRTTQQFLPARERYWRGAILPVDNGMTWIVGRAAGNAGKTQRPPSLAPTAVTQEVMLEPRFDKWLFVPEVPHWVDFNDRLLNHRLHSSVGRVFSLRQGVSKALLYQTYSVESYRENLTPEELAIYLQVPEETDARVLKLVAQATTNPSNTEGTAAALLKFFQEQFRYSLEPGTMQTSQVGEFLFEKKIGFCEHFAAAFAHLMRLAGIPARIVVGFQGGQLNELGDYLLVKDSDAHAWTEIWSAEKKQWLRYDPTAVVAPLRLELGGEVFNNLTQEQLLARRSSNDYLAQYRQSWNYRLFGRSALAIDALATRWNYFLLSYNKEGQQLFLQKWGIGHLTNSGLGLLSVVIIGLFYWWARWQSRAHQPITPAQQAYLRLCQLLQKKGLPRLAHEGPQSYLERVIGAWPEHRDDLSNFKKIYLPWRYSFHRPAPQDIKCLYVALKKLQRARFTLLDPN